MAKIAGRDVKLIVNGQEISANPISYEFDDYKPESDIVLLNSVKNEISFTGCYEPLAQTVFDKLVTYLPKHHFVISSSLWFLPRYSLEGAIGEIRQEEHYDRLEFSFDIMASRKDFTDLTKRGWYPSILRRLWYNFGFLHWALKYAPEVGAINETT